MPIQGRGNWSLATRFRHCGEGRIKSNLDPGNKSWGQINHATVSDIRSNCKSAFSTKRVPRAHDRKFNSGTIYREQRIAFQNKL
jgi:hypothetical protein